jgi:hypothetical protein
VRQVDLIDTARGASPERWTLAKQPHCNEFACSYLVTSASEGGHFVLRAAGKYTWTGRRSLSADCVNGNAPYRVMQANGYSVIELVQFSLDPASPRRASVDEMADYTARQSALRINCNRTGSATWVGNANYAGSGHGSNNVSASQVGPGANSGVSASPITPSTTSGAPARPPAAGQSVGRQRRARDQTLHAFLEAAFNQPVACRSIAQLPRTGTAQLTCSIGGETLVATRLSSQAALDDFLKLRYRQAYPFYGSVAHCSNSGIRIGTWYDSTGRTRGPWGERQIRGRFEVLWGYDDRSVAVVATGSLGRASAVCNVWYAHSG